MVRIHHSPRMKISNDTLTQWTAELALIAYIALIAVAAAIILT